MSKNSQLLFDDMTFKELLGQSLKHWRKALVIGLLVAVLFSGFNFLISYKTFSSEMSENAREKTETKISELKESIALLDSQILVQQNYIDNSILMNINPNTVINASLVYYIKTYDADVQLEKKVNYTYYSMVCSGEIAECVSEKDGFSDSDYLQEVITAEINVDSEAPCITVYVKHYDEDKVSKLLDAISEIFNEKREELADSVGSFELKEISRSISSISSPALLDSQTEAYTALSTLQDTLDEKEAMLEELTNSVSMGNLTLKTAVFFVLGFAVGFIALVIWYMILILASSNIKSANQLVSNYSVRVFGDFVSFDGKKTVFDSLAYRLSDESIDVSEEQTVKLIKNNIEISADDKSILVVSLSKDEKVEFLREHLCNVENVISVSDIAFDDPNTVKELKNADAVLIVAKKFENTLYQLDMAKKEVEYDKKEFLGVILI